MWTILPFLLVLGMVQALHDCVPSGHGRMRFTWGDALLGGTDCMGPDGHQYPTTKVDEVVASLSGLTQARTRTREGRSLFERAAETEDPFRIQDLLMRTRFGEDFDRNHRRGRSFSRGSSNSTSEECSDGTPPRLCRSSMNTTAPLFGVSLTSGQNVTIVQKFPDLLQQVVYEVCESSQCAVIHGECVQTYVPHLFLVVPLGPVTLTGQDYILVESGCVCRPKYATGNTVNPLELTDSDLKTSQ